MYLHQSPSWHFPKNNEGRCSLLYEAVPPPHVYSRTRSLLGIKMDAHILLYHKSLKNKPAISHSPKTVIRFFLLKHVQLYP